MTTTLKTKKETKSKTQAVETPVAKEYREPKRLSKAAIWRQNNPNGIITVLDWKAVNK